MPALEMAQESGKIIRWLKSEGATVTKGEPLMEIETDKVTVEIEAPASGILTNITAREGDVVPVGQTIAVILAPDEQSAPSASPVARKIAAEHGVDLARVKPSGGRIEKADVLAYLGTTDAQRPQTVAPRPIAASPKARRLAQERGIDLATLRGTGPAGAILAADVPTASISNLQPPISNTWRVMAERMVQSWTTAPHFFLTREVNASRLVTWRERVNARAAEKITFTDLLVKIVATALRQHPRLNAAWRDGALVLHDDINIGIAVAIEEGLVVPVIHRADTLTLAQIAARRAEVVARAQAGKLRLDDVQGGTFTLSNLGMYGVDAFHAIVNPPQAAILAVGRIAERVVAVNGQPSVQPMLTLTLSCDHRVVDGARGAQFLGSIAEFIEEPLELLLLR
jgi:pyruvate dehydrogenase E2 component (dihydrolipoamide acetyltransferase)